MFKKLINTFVFFLALGVFFVARPAYAVDFEDNHFCLNGPGNGAACEGMTSFGCVGPIYIRNAQGQVTKSVGSYSRSGIPGGGVIYLHSCDQQGSPGKKCCVKRVLCFQEQITEMNSNQSKEVFCERARRELVANPVDILGTTCYGETKADAYNQIDCAAERESFRV